MSSSPIPMPPAEGAGSAGSSSPGASMTDFRRYRCWETAVAAATLTTEAVSPSPAVFFATHAPLRIYRSPASGRGSDNPGVPVDEEEVRKDFLTRASANGILLMPVIGQ